MSEFVSMQEAMRPIMSANTELTDKWCDIHNQPFVKVKKTGEILCLKCGHEERQAYAEERGQKMYEREEEAKRLSWLKDFSLVDDELKDATFKNFKVSTDAQQQDLDFVKEKAREWIKGSKNNIVLIGDVGVGKSHLAYSAIKAISDYNHKHAAMVNVVDLMAKIKEDFSAEADYIKRLSEVDYLVLDDLGTEKVTEWSSGVLYSLLNKRSNTMVTTNIGPTDIMKRYGKRIYSRIFKGVDDKQLHFMANKDDERVKLWTK